MKKLITTALAALVSVFCFSQNIQNPWQDVPERDFAKKNQERRIAPQKYRSLSLDLTTLDSILAKAPMRFSQAAEGKKPLLSIPMPDGSFLDFELVEAPIMHPDLAARYPYIRSFAGISTDDPTAYLRCGVTQKGFHAVIFSARHSTVYIDAYAEGDAGYYISYLKKDYQKTEAFECLADELPENQLKAGGPGGDLPELAGDCKMRTYMLALACTGEYAQFHGGTVPLVMAEYNVAMTRVNGVFEKDLRVTMQLVANTDDLIFLNASTDPYSNGNGSTMLGQNQTTCDNVIGNSNYDIGHVFSTGGGGVASLFSVCSTNNKARGVTGQNSPIGDPFYIDYVVHEMGHQYGANHTQNNDCNRNDPTAMEPGSASTIMGYAGICAPDVQAHSDDYFHIISILEMSDHITGGGNFCASTVTGGNSAPSISLPSSFYNVPVSTPFVLRANGSDPNGDVLTYCWEQMDNEVATMPPQPTNTVGPAFRSLPPVEEPYRYFPNLPSLLSNTNTTWEVLPAVSRSMNFFCTARDNHIGGGCTNEANLTLSFTASAGPFVVTAPNGSTVVWTALNNETVTWNVANTNLAPVSTANVEILLSVDGGFTYPYTLAASTPNDGSQTVAVPNITSTLARIMVKGVNNIFFDISDKNFTIQAPLFPTFTMTVDPPVNTTCVGQDAVFYQINVQPVAGFNQNVSFSATGVPPGATISFNPPALIPPGSSTMLLTNLDAVPPGTYNITVTGTSLTLMNSVPVQLVLLDTIAGPPLPISPANGATGVASSPTPLTWQPVANASYYFVQIATDPGFSNIVQSDTTSATTFLANTSEATVYYWRIRAVNLCGNGPYSTTFAFQTEKLECAYYESNPALPIPNTAPPIMVMDIISVAEDFPLASLEMELDISHTWVSDLIVDIVTPDGTTLHLFDQPGLPGSDCEEDDILIKLTDTAANSAADLESTCNTTPPAIDGQFQPLSPFATANGESTQGDWKLIIQDVFTDDGGMLNHWSLDFCGSVVLPPATLLINLPLVVQAGQNGTITSSLLQAQGAPGSSVFTLLTLPANGILYLQGIPLNIGGSFTQADINSGFLVYGHDGSNSTADDFHFDLTDANGGWLHDQIFNIEILTNTLSATAELTQGITCHNDNNAIITIVATGGNIPLIYSLNGGPSQGSPVFTNLGPGTYTATVEDALGFTLTTNSVTVVNPPAITMSASVNDDDITVSASGGTGSLEYSIDGVNFQSSNVFLDLPNGIYTITVQDENGCTETTSATVAVNTLVVIAVETPISCFGANDGEITVVVVGGGNPPFEYSLNGGPFQSNPVFTNLGPGAYTATVMDADGFTQSTSSLTLSNPPQLTAAATVAGDTITVNANGGTGNLEYSIDGVSYQSSNVFPNLPNGTYTITVLDENGCTATTMATVSVNTLNILATVTQGIDCFGEMTGEISVTASGGNPPYTFSLNGGPFQSSTIFSDLGPGSYEVEVMDDDGFTQTSNSVTISQPSQIIVSASVADDTITVNASGGTGNLEYSIDGVNFQGSNVFPNLPNGTYTVIVLDENGCTATTTATVSVNNLNILAAITQGIDCFGEMTGEITATASGGNPPYTYSLNGGPFQSSTVFSNLVPGSYEVEVMDGDGFTQTSNIVTISQPSQISASASVAGDTITVSASGGTGSLEYSIDGVNFQVSNVFAGLAPGIYTITVLDENGCTATTSATIAAPPLVISANVVQVVGCFGEMTGEISATVSGGNPPYQFSLNGGPFQSSSTFSNLAAGIYTVTVMDEDGSTQTSNSVTVTTPSLLTANAVVNANDITVNANGGTPGYLYSVSGGPFQGSNQFFDLPNGSYTVVVADANGCSATTTAVVLFNNLIAQISITQGIGCFGENDGEITASASGGSTPYEYSLNGGPFQSSPVFDSLGTGNYILTVMDADGLTQSSPSIALAQPALLTATSSVVDDDVTVTATGGTPPFLYSLDGITYQSSNEFFNLPNGTYNIQVLDENGCSTTTTATVFTNTLNLLATITHSISCFGGNNGEITVVASGGNLPYQFNLNGGPFQSSNIFQNVAAGSYTVMVMDGDGFTQTTNVTLSNPPQINITTLTNGYTVTVVANGGVGALLYSLDGGPFQQNAVFFPVSSGSHIITVQDANACEETASVTVTVPALSLNLAITQTLPCSYSQTGQITANGGGGIPIYLYNLNGGPFQPGNVFSGLSAGSYTVTIKDSGGFTVSQNINLAAPPIISASANVAGSNVLIMASGGTGAFQFSLNGGPFQSSNTFLNVPNGQHTVTIQDANDCEAIISVTVNASSIQVTATLTQGISCHNESDAIITVSANGGTAPYEYSLDGVNFQASNVFNDLPPGNYSIVVKDATGATSSTPTIVVANPPALVLTASAFGFQITAMGSGGTGTLQYSLDGGTFQTSNVFNAPSNGSYTITVRDANGCTLEMQVTVSVPDAILVNTTPVTCFGGSDGQFAIQAINGGTAPYQFSVDGGPFTDLLVYTGLAAGTHSIVVKDATGYEAALPNISITEPQPITAWFEMNGYLSIHASGGAAPYEYSLDGGQNFQADSIFNDLIAGQYDIAVKDANGCLFSITLIFNSTNEATNGLHFDVLPNPSSGLFLVKMDLSRLSNLKISVYDVLGQLVFQSEMEAIGSLSSPIDIQHLPSGSYQLRVNDGEHWGVKRLVVAR